MINAADTPCFWLFKKRPGTQNRPSSLKVGFNWGLWELRALWHFSTRSGSCWKADSAHLSRGDSGSREEAGK